MVCDAKMQAAVAKKEKETAVQAAQEGQLRNMRTLELEHTNAAQVQHTARAAAVSERMRLQRMLNKYEVEASCTAGTSKCKLHLRLGSTTPCLHYSMPYDQEHVLLFATCGGMRQARLQGA